jgi:hypothetical protein
MEKGAAVAREMTDQGFAGSIVGFSSDDYVRREFKEVGALGAIDKEAGFPEASIKKLASLLGQ